jgi:hypothetical protein
MKNRTAVLTALVLAATAGTAAAGGNPPAPDEVKPLYALVGTWKGTATLTMGTDSIPVKVKITCSKVSGGWAVGCKMTATGIPGMSSYEESDLFGYDAGAQTYHWYAMTNTGEVHDHAGKLDDQGNLVVQENGTADGKKLREDITMTLGKKQTTWKSETFVDGQSMALFTGTVKKK